MAESSWGGCCEGGGWAGSGNGNGGDGGDGGFCSGDGEAGAARSQRSGSELEEYYLGR